MAATRSSNEITVGYWSTKGLGSVCRQMVIYADIPLKAKIYKLEAILADRKITATMIKLYREIFKEPMLMRL